MTSAPMSPPPLQQDRTWWRRNHWGLIALPLLLALALAAGSSRVHDYWWLRGFHDRVQVTDGVASLVDEYDDGHLQYPIEARYSLSSFDPADITLIDGDPLPPGVRAWQVRLHVEADPDMSLSGCQVALVDSEGNQFGKQDSGLLISSGFDDCVPSDRPGPQPEFGSTAPPKLGEGQEPRPAEYDTSSVFVLPEESDPAAIRLWYFLPTYVELPLNGERG